MQSSPSTVTGSSGPLPPHKNGRAEAVDRSYLLRRATKYPFPVPLEDHRLVRIRRGRRVFSSFAGIPPLSRRGSG